VSNGEGEGQTQTETATETETATAPAETEPAETETVTQTETVEPEPEPTDMPGVVGVDYREASDTILDAGLLPTSYPVASDEEQATVVAQNPAEGTALNEGTTVRMNVSLGPGDRAAGTIPDLRDGEAAEALSQCHEAGYTCRLVDRGTSRAQSKGRVIGQRPAPGASAPSLTQITLAIGR
jgi:eukaryotic-like serine/threonine-protein kinase